MNRAELVRCAERLEALGSAPPRALRMEAWDALDRVRSTEVLRAIAPEEREAWAAAILRAVDASGLTIGLLLRRRAALYEGRPLFRLAGGRTLSFRQVAHRAESLARGLLSLAPRAEPGRVAILSENRLEMAIADLACFTGGIVSVLVPANATAADVRRVLLDTGAATVIVSSAEQAAKVLPHRPALPDLRHVIVMDKSASAPGTLPLEEVAARADRVPEEELAARLERIATGDLATIMVTSGTTGAPKGIRFSHRNVLFKRFARALSLPEIGESDVFLCYLPLYHTFGRFLEMLGCLFWGSLYCFLDDPSVEALVEGMRRERPTVFISVPRKWIQLHEAVLRAADPERASAAEVLEATRRLTGGRLRFGLSAAGVLSPEVFRFFQGNGVELLSGFGMTEATGGITMTPPGGYRDDSLGVPLPGIETELAPDGELLVRGPYVMMGYVDESEAPSFDGDGWFHTGDLMERDPDGHFRIVDRKKEIYKNVKGQTIAPQRIEGLFRDFESVGRVFVVGDHREYNTALIYPSPQYRAAHLAGLSYLEVKAHYRSLVVSVNSFLAPFERIVDFAIVERDLDEKLGELTPKGTPRRKVVERGFADTIRLLYRRTEIVVGDVAVTIPNWLFQALGITAEDLEVRDGSVRLPGREPLPIRKESRGVARVGSCTYRHPPGPLPLGVLLTTPRLWLGNEELVRAVPLDLRGRARAGREGEAILWDGRVAPALLDEALARSLAEAPARATLDVSDLHAAAVALFAREEGNALEALRVLELAAATDDAALAEAARVVLARAVFSPLLRVRRRAFVLLAPIERDARVSATLRSFLARPGVLLDASTREALCERTLTEPVLDAFLQAALDACLGSTFSRGTEGRASSLLRFVSAYGASHPASYRKLRAFLVRTVMASDRGSVREEAERALASMEEGFHAWLGPAPALAVDPETGREYGFKDVVVFDDDVPEEIRARILAAIRDEQLLREGIFLLSGGTQVRLSDISPRGVWVRHLGTRHGKAVFRVTVQTRYGTAHELAVNVNLSLPRAAVLEEIRWLVLCGPSEPHPPLVEEFGALAARADVWSEEFVAGETLDHAARRLTRNERDRERLRQMWPFFAWSALASYVDFWERTGRRREIAEPGLENVIVPTHDYQTGARLVSISPRRPHESLARMLAGFREFVLRAEERFPLLEGLAGWDVIFSSLLEIVGEEEGLVLLRSLLREERDPACGAALKEALAPYVATVERRGFLPMRLFFAAQRYRRWVELSVDPTPQARARTLLELYDTYGLDRLRSAYPAARVRLFRETVLKHAQPPVVEGLEQIIGRLRRREIHPEETVDAVSALRAKVAAGPDEDYFLARLSFPHLRPDDAAAFVPVDLGGRRRSEMVVALEDAEGDAFRVRHALSPREVGALHRLFLAAKLDVRFRPEHQYLLALNDRDQIIAGIFYETDEENASAHLEKIVVGERYRKLGVAEGLMHEFFHRMRAAGLKTVTTGFFRPEFFYAHGFAIEKRHAGLVKTLD